MTRSTLIATVVLVALTGCAGPMQDRSSPSAMPGPSLAGSWKGVVSDVRMTDAAGPREQRAELDIAEDGTWTMVTRGGGRTWTSKGATRVAGRSVVLDGSVVSGPFAGEPVELELTPGFNRTLSGWGDTFFQAEAITAGYTFHQS